jgi:RNA-directed DNA polymerase
MSGDVQVRFCERPGVRFPRATHLVVVFEKEVDARRFAEVLPKRFAKYGLRLHPEKTRLIEFKRPRTSPEAGGSDTESFDLLGFTHFWGRSRKGKWMVRKQTAKGRFKRTLQRISMWCRRNRHLAVEEQHKGLSAKLRGHDAYFGITPNGPALQALRYQVRRIWFKWLKRRSWKSRWNWERMNRLLERLPLPPARVVHSAYRT